MDSIYLVIIITLLGLAVLDLIVGVSNDAVNFLNSSIGSKVAPIWLILTVASAGVLIGSLFSSGMMEVARNGVFYPQMFSFNSIMILFLAVMITDVILLDVFNTFGLPTSTTVSLVFELLGSAVAVSLYTIWQNDFDINTLGEYINTAKALKIISGIFISVVVAFGVGAIVMYFSRLLFSFNYKKSFKWVGAVWSGLALTAITYFIVFKGLKGSTLVSKDVLTFLNEHMNSFLIYSFVGWSAIMAVFQHLLKANILKFIILMGTAALALAFAGNDLVNFIGVFMAGLSSYEIAGAFVANGGNLNDLYMTELGHPVQVDWRYLFGAGVIMVLALSFSKKSKSVTKTTVDLSRQGDGVETFASTQASRSLVRRALSLGKLFKLITPVKVQDFLTSRFEPSQETLKGNPSFDLIRASVNLTVAALLISAGTSLKLPLSTTYVTFMVAMGSSLADKAWGRESAVYRITGVLTVISGWFLTALVAFTVSLIIAFVLLYGGNWAIFGMILLVAFLLIQFAIVHKKREEKQEEIVSREINNEHDLIVSCSAEMENAIEKYVSILKSTLDGLFHEDRRHLHQLNKEAEILYRRYKNLRHNEVVPTLKRIQSASVEIGMFYVQNIDYFYEISKSLKVITESSYKFIDNNHEGLSKEQYEDLQTLADAVIDVSYDFLTMIKARDYSNFDNLLEKRHLISDLFSQASKNQIKRAKGNTSGTRNSILYLSILNETKIIALQSSNLMKSQKRLVKLDK